MSILLKVKWVDQSPDTLGGLPQRVQRIGGETGALRWKHTQAEAIEAIESGHFVYYIELNAQPLRLDVARTPDGQKYLTVQDAGGQTQLLLDLPEFPNPTPHDSAAR